MATKPDHGIICKNIAAIAIFTRVDSEHLHPLVSAVKAKCTCGTPVRVPELFIGTHFKTSNTRARNTARTQINYLNVLEQAI